jgi:hypothetical protein
VAVFSYLSKPSTLIATGLVVVLLQIVDLSAGDTWAVNINDRVSLEHIILYSVIIVASIIIQVILLSTSIKLTLSIKKPASHIAEIVTYVYVISQLTIIILLSYLLSEELITSRYATALSQLIIGISLVISVLIMISLTLTCLKSYFTRRSKMAAVYAIAITALSVQLISAFFYVEISLFDKPEYITPERNPWGSYNYSALNSKLYSVYNTIKNLSFFAVWAASVILTKSNIERIGKIKYCAIVGIPIIYFSLQYSPLLLEQMGTLGPLLTAKGSIFPYIYNFVLNTVNVGSGILFGISLFMLARTINFEQLKYYLTISGVGIMILFSSNVSTILTLSTFPAWAIVSLSFVLPASFLIMIGLDSATFYVAGDITVRKFLRRFKDRYDLFAALGSAEASAAAERKIREISSRIYDGLEPPNLFTGRTESENIREYVRIVMAEMKKSYK